MKATFEGMEVSVVRQIDANWYVVSLAGAEFTANVSELVFHVPS